MWLCRIKGQLLYILPFSTCIGNENKIIHFPSVSVILHTFVSFWSAVTLLSCYSSFQYFFSTKSYQEGRSGGSTYTAEYWVLRCLDFCHRISIEPVRVRVIFFFFFIVVGFVIHWNESAMCLHVFPIPVPPPTSLSTRSLKVFPVHQVQALVSCIQPGLVICFTVDNIHVSML